MLLAESVREFAAVIEPMMLFLQFTVPVPVISIPYKVMVEPPVTVIEPFPVSAPITFPCNVPISTFPPSMLIAFHVASPALLQLMF